MGQGRGATVEEHPKKGERCRNRIGVEYSRKEKEYLENLSCDNPPCPVLKRDFWKTVETQNSLRQMPYKMWDTILL